MPRSSRPSQRSEPAEPGKPEKRSKPEKYSPSWFWPLGGVLVPFIRATTKLRLRGVENVPETGAFVLSPNHFTNIDPVIIAVALWRIGRAPRFLAKASLFKVPVLGAALRVTGQIPVERSGVTRNAVPLDSAEALVREQKAVIIYPEGSLTRDPDVWPMRGKSGAVRVALEQGIDLIPVAHWGAQGLLPRYGKKLKLFPRTKIDILFGEPVDLSAYRGKPIDQALLTAATEVVMQSITGLLEQLRGEKAPAERWDPKSKGQTETGRF
ncbi:1-acyl-sn-glycerol-3-phosphate acyltransferase [Herbiconiux sp. L3-i23]|uniref:lysophospholipid acyltransferase family protein n=1 Tax=Herbiconiux sp. L3-i23 TaxID=2905871 RepID=UPI00206CAD98|nr:lysophospholipid acyltransferase family protein [Herbiconiux sp. L3-i23]BDI21827.1 1-acyl-sn-glycerol-3-phosphate acyltransferase [Herbiconiux sp. L3-i23]